MATALATIERPTAYEVARLHWNAARAAHRALHAKLEGAKAAYAQISVPEDEDGPKSPRLAALAQDYLGGRRASVAKLTAEIAAFQEEIEDGADAYAIARAAWELERGLEQHRRTEAARPSLQAAAQRIGRLVEQLSAEVIAARSSDQVQATG